MLFKSEELKQQLGMQNCFVLFWPMSFPLQCRRSRKDGPVLQVAEADACISEPGAEHWCFIFGSRNART